MIIVLVTQQGWKRGGLLNEKTKTKTKAKWHVKGSIIYLSNINTYMLLMFSDF